MGLDLRYKHHIAVIGNRHVWAGLAGLFHQRTQHRSAGLDHLDAPCKRTADAKRLDPDCPKLAFLVELQVTEILQRHQQPVSG